MENDRWIEAAKMNPGKDTGKARREAQIEWAKRRQAHLDNPDPGIVEGLMRKVGDIPTSLSLTLAERQDPQAIAEKAPQKTSSVYDAMLKARSAGITPSLELQEKWEIIRRGGIPKD